MHCKNCGEIILENSDYCLKCGYQVGSGKNYCKNCGSETRGAELCLGCGQLTNSMKKGVNNNVFCSACGKQISVNDKFCPNCGKPSDKLVVICPNCQSDNPFGADICLSCGQRLSKVSKEKVQNDAQLFKLGKVFSIVGISGIFLSLLLRVFSNIISFVAYDAFFNQSLDVDKYFEQQRGVEMLLQLLENPVMLVIYLFSSFFVIAGVVLFGIAKVYRIKVLNLFKFIALISTGAIAALSLLLSCFINKSGMHVTTLVFICIFIGIVLIDLITYFFLHYQKEKTKQFVFNCVISVSALVIIILVIHTNMQYAKVWEIFVEEAKRFNTSIRDSWMYRSNIFNPGAILVGEIDNYVRRYATHNEKFYYDIWGISKVTRFDVLVENVLIALLSIGAMINVISKKNK